MPDADTYTGLESQSPKMEDTGNAQDPRETGEGLLEEVSAGSHGVLGEGREEWGALGLGAPSYIMSGVPVTSTHHAAVFLLHLRRPRENLPAGRRPGPPLLSRALCGDELGLL